MSDAERAPGTLWRTVRAIVTTATVFAIYLLWSGSIAATEIGTGAVVAIGVALWSAAQRGVSHRRYRFSARHAAPLLRAAADIPAATARTFAALARIRPPARADERRFRHGAEDDPRDRARRATAIFAASLTPASYVVRAEQGRDTALFHGLGRPPVEQDEWLA